MRYQAIVRRHVAGVALLLGATSLANAQDQSGVNAVTGAESPGGPVAELALAQDLYLYGIKQEDALSVLAAARIAQQVETTDVERQVETQPIEGADQSEGAELAEAPAALTDMFAAAEMLAAGDPGLMGLIEDAKAEGSRGRMGGASRTLSRLRAGRRDHFTVAFYGGELAEIAILGDGDADLDLLVTDENGNTICVDRSYSDQLYCSFTPVWNGNFHVIVDNVGRIRNSYYILTN